jgi:hypothetical protein
MKFYSYAEDNNYCLAKINYDDPNFSLKLKSLKDLLPVKKFYKEKNAWMLPISDLSKLTSFCNRTDLQYRIVDKESLIESYNKIKQWKDIKDILNQLHIIQKYLMKFIK